MTFRPYGATDHDFTVDTTRRLLDKACRTAGLDSGDAQVLRHHTNAVYLVGQPPHQVVVKIRRPGVDRDQDLRHGQALVALTTWLTEHGVPTTTLLDHVPQPLLVDDHVVTLWHYLPQQRPMTTAAIAPALLALHQAPAPAIELPSLDPLAAIGRSIEVSRILTGHQRSVLTDRLERLAPAWTQLATPPHLIHTDPQHRNTLWRHTTSDEVVLCDLDDATLGPVEWDLVTIEIHSRRFGYHDYDAFCAAYGRDIRGWTGYTDLRDLRELRMITTNARKSAPNSPQAAEVVRRIEGLDRDPDERWRIL